MKKKKKISKFNIFLILLAFLMLSLFNAFSGGNIDLSVNEKLAEARMKVAERQLSLGGGSE